ncbi:MAG: hypothetical protein ABIE42_09185 [Candidatus Eisenbacteria bacterium]
MALVAIKGEPGMFWDSVTQQKINISEWREDDKWDTTMLVNGAVALNHTLNFFRDLTNKEILDTNFATPRKIPEGEEMRLERIGVHIPTALGNTVPPPADIKKVAENGYLMFQLNRKDVAEGPLVKFPSGYGLAGNTVETDAGIVTIGTPATAAAAKLAREQLITPRSDCDGVITYHKRTWASTDVVAAGLSAAAGGQTPTLAGDVMVRLYLHGLIRSAATKG